MAGIRTPAGIVVLAVIASACSSGGEPPATLPAIPASLPVPEGGIAVNQGCLLAVGEALGAEVVDVEASSPADGTLEVGDILLSIGGAETPTAASVVAEVQGREAGESVAIGYERNGVPEEARVTLAPSPTGTETPFLGVRIVTRRDEYGPDALPEGLAPTGPLTRLAPVGGSLLALDALAVEWSLVSTMGPEDIDSYASIGGEVYVLEFVETGPSILTGLVSGSALVLDRLGDWRPFRALAPLGDRILLLAERGEGGEAEVPTEAGIVAVDPTDGTIVWEWLPGIPAGTVEGDIPVPVAAFSSPARDRALVAMVSSTSGSLGHAMLDVEGAELTGWPGSQAAFLPRDAVARGWFGEQTLLYRSVESNDLLTFDLDSGTSGSPIEVEVADIDGLWPLGDGRHLLTRTPTTLLLVDALGEEENRRLARGCQVGTLSDPGWLP